MTKTLDQLVCEKFDVKCAAYAPYREAVQFKINYLGYEQVKKCIPYTLTEIKNALPKDENLNNLPIRKWDLAAGFVRNGSRWDLVGSQLTALYRSKGINAFSCAQGVSILKECARMWANEV